MATFVNGGETDVVAMAERIRQLEAQIARTKAREAARLSCKVSAKGAVSVYGMGKWPVTLYRSQWEALEKFMPRVVEFIADNASSLSEKGE